SKQPNVHINKRNLRHSDIKAINARLYVIRNNKKNILARVYNYFYKPCDHPTITSLIVVTTI
ncbi:unnamed protein product, partial [Ceratitis capitata]